MTYFSLICNPLNKQIFILQSVKALINDFKDTVFTYKAAHIFFTDGKKWKLL